MEKKQKRNYRSIINFCIILGIVVGACFLVDRVVNAHHVKIGDHLITVDIAEKTIDQERGLSGRKGLCQDCGMLFIFTHKKQRTFWMKDMQFDIDVLWISNDLIVGMQENILHGRQAQETFSSQKPVDKVLELPVGFIEKHKISIGQKVEFLEK